MSIMTVLPALLVLEKTSPIPAHMKLIHSSTTILFLFAVLAAVAAAAPAHAKARRGLIMQRHRHSPRMSHYGAVIV